MAKFLTEEFVSNFDINQPSSDAFYDAWSGSVDEDGFISFVDSDAAIKEDLCLLDESTAGLFMRDFDKGNIICSQDGKGWQPFI